MFLYMIGVELIFIFAFDFMEILNADFLASDYKEMMIYPIQLKNLFSSKVFHISIINLMISLLMYGFMLIDFGIMRYNPSEAIQIFVQNTFCALLPVIYFFGICLTIFTIIALIKKNKGIGKNFIALMIFDAFVILSSVIFFRMTKNILFDLFLIGFVMVSYIVLYLLGGSIYSYIMNSLQFKTKDKKAFGLKLKETDFKQKNRMLSYFIRDIKIMIRVPSFRYTYLILLILIPGIYTGLLLEMGKSYRATFANHLDWIFMMSAFLIPTFLGSCEMIGGYALSKEGVFINTLKALPIQKEKIVFVKYIQTVLSGVPVLICCNILLVIFPMSEQEIFFYELYLFCYCLIYPFLVIEQDFYKPYVTWNTVKELFSDFIILRACLPMIGFPVFSLLVFAFYEFTHIINQEIFIGILFVIPMVWGYFSFQRMKKTLKQWYQ